MARTASPKRDKNPVRIRFQELANGNKSVYLDIYREGRRRREYLKMYLVPERRPLDRVQNEQTMNAARHIQAQRVMELNNQTAQIHGDPRGAKISLADWMEFCLDEHERKGFRSRNSLQSHVKVIKSYGADIALKNIDKDYCAGFVDFMRTKYVSRSRRKGEPGKRLAPGSMAVVFSSLRSVLNSAVRAGIISFNPCSRLNPSECPHPARGIREFLSVEEVKALMETPSKSQVKNAFLFACFCGLRHSDIAKLRWGDISEQNGATFATTVMKKTGLPLYLPLSKAALRWLPERGAAKDNDLVFPRLPRVESVAYSLKRWLKRAGITRRITFHASRHTFATTSLTLGADLYTVSKLLGHTDVETTQIYAKIVNSKKEEAVNLFDGVFCNPEGLKS